MSRQREFKVLVMSPKREKPREIFRGSEERACLVRNAFGAGVEAASGTREGWDVWIEEVMRS